MVGMSIEQRVPDKQRYQPAELPWMKRAFPVWGVARNCFLWSFLLEKRKDFNLPFHSSLHLKDHVKHLSSPFLFLPMVRGLIWKEYGIPTPGDFMAHILLALAAAFMNRRNFLRKQEKDIKTFSLSRLRLIVGIIHSSLNTSHQSWQLITDSYIAQISGSFSFNM